MEIKKIEEGNFVIVKYKRSENILFAAFFKRPLENRGQIAQLIKNHLKTRWGIVEVEYSEIRYTPFIVKEKDGFITEFEYLCKHFYEVF